MPMEPHVSNVYVQLIATLRELLPCTSIAVLIDDDAGIAIPAQYGIPALPPHLVITSESARLLERLRTTRQPLLIRRDEPFRPPLPAAGAAQLAWLAAPIDYDSQVFGYVSMAGAFEPGDELRAMVATRQAGLALQWATRWGTANLQSRRLRELSQRIRQAHDHDTALALIVDASIELTGATHCCIFANKQGRAVMLARRGYSPDEAALVQQIPPSLEHGLTGQAFQSRTPAQSNDIANDPDALPALASTRSQLIIPIASGNTSQGFIDLQSPQPFAFARLDAGLLASLGDLATIALEHKGTRARTTSNSETEIIAEHDLLLSSRLAVVTDLAAGVAHEINNPLTTILGYTHLLLRNQSLTQDTRNDIQHIMVEGQRIASLVERFLRFAQPSSSGKCPVPIGEPLLEALGLLRSRLQEVGIQLTLDIPATPPMVLGQAGQLEQAFLELLQNAIEAMSISGERQLNVQVAEQASWVRVAVADSGRGIRPDLLSRVFEPGFTTKVDKGISRGLGLGLYAVHTIAHDHWGRVEVHSQVGRGSTFTLCLPAI